MTEDTHIEYSYVIQQKYEDLEDGSPNMHFSPAVKVMGTARLPKFLELLSYNSNLSGHSITNINYKLPTND